MTTPSTALPDMLSAALEYASRGWHVLPLKPGGKSPLAALVPHGRLNATADPETIRRWWTDQRDANVGIALAQSGLLAVDVDRYKPGCTWGAFAAGIEKPATLEQRTGNGGIHYVFRADGGRYAGRLPGVSGVDLLHHHYIVAAPSVVGGRPYSWETDDEPEPACPCSGKMTR